MNGEKSKKKRKKWPMVLLLVMGVLLMFLLVGCEDDWDEDEYDWSGDWSGESGYGDYCQDDEWGQDGYWDDGCSSEDFWNDECAPGYGPDYGGDDYWDDFWDEGYPEDEYFDDQYFDGDNPYNNGGESWWGDWDENYTFTSNSGIFSEDDYPIGMATKLEGNVIVYSMFVNDNANSWNFNSSSDKENEAYVERQLALSMDYLEKEAASYGKNLNLIYDWGQDSDLCCTFTVNDTCTGDSYYYSSVYEYIDLYIAPVIQMLQQRYDSDSVVFMAYLNTQNSLQETSCTFPKWGGEGGMYEICFMHTRSYNEYESAAGYAHEICHAFGAPDLYRADEGGDNFGITQEYVNYNERTQANELMYTTYNCKTYAIEYDHISNDITDVTAYYLGWIDNSSTVNEWGFDNAEEK